MPGVRKATKADAGSLVATLASAFAEDPVMRWMSGQDDTERRMTPFWKGMVGISLRPPDHEVFISEDGSSGAIWRGVDNWKLAPLDIVRSGPGMLASLRGRLPMALGLLGKMEKAHPEEPHYYLEILGTRRDRQGSGGGSAVMQLMTERCDTEGLPAYLESSNPRNVAFYVRHGFKETGEVHAPKGGPSMTTMWREPR